MAARTRTAEAIRYEATEQALIFKRETVVQAVRALDNALKQAKVNFDEDIATAEQIRNKAVAQAWAAYDDAKKQEGA